MPQLLRPSISFSMNPSARIEDIYFDVCTTFPECLFSYQLVEDGEGNIELREVSWGRLMAHAMRVASYLAPSLGDSLSSSPMGNVVAFLADSDYTYFVYLLAIWLSGWAVCPFTFHVHTLSRTIEYSDSALVNKKQPRWTDESAAEIAISCPTYGSKALYYSSQTGRVNSWAGGCFNL